jgi:hypothetical protein
VANSANRRRSSIDTAGQRFIYWRSPMPENTACPNTYTASQLTVGVWAVAPMPCANFSPVLFTIPWDGTSAKRRIRRTSPGGTITRWVYDQRSNIIGTYVGTDDTGATPTDPTGGAPRAIT